MKKICVLLLAFLSGTALYSQPMSEAETKAMALANDGKLAEAASAFEAIYNADNKNTKALYTLTELYEDLGELQKAYPLASKGASLNPDVEDWAFLKAEIELKLGNNDAVIQTANNFLAKHSDAAFIYFIKAKALDAQSKIQLAIGAYSKAIANKPGYVNALYLRAKDFVAISRYQNGVDDFSKVIELAPKNDEVYNQRGLAYYSLKQMNEAYADFSKAIEYNPKNKYAYANRGWVNFNNGNDANALADFENSNAIKNYADAYYGLASVYKKQKQYSLAIENIQKAISLDDKMPAYFAIYSSVLAASSRNDEALTAAEKILTLDANSPDGFILKATALSNLEKYEEAVKTITMGIQQYSDNYLMYGLRSFIYKQQGKTSLAEADNQKAKELSTKE
ncbi:MAG: tetratricopeptide repeat protein [Bacteroidetes bacterium]|nr:tetratricopeptide repeat protein [Bacteroidota bacterium]MBS1756897.1 tetratricopeptide repeat protein [Bacteroidota bacterium]